VAGADGRLDGLDETEVVESPILWMRAGRDVAPDRLAHGLRFLDQ
jgi:hypothetical protein